MSNIEHVRSTAARAAHGATAAVAGRSASLPQAGAAPGAGFADLLGLMGLANEGAELVPGLAGDAPSDSASDSASDPVGVGVGTSLAQGTVGGWPLGSEGLAPAGAPPEVAAADAGAQAGAVPPQWMMQMAVLRGTPPAVSAGAPAASAASAAGGVGAVSGPGVGVGVASAAPGLSAAAQEAGAALAGRLGQDSALSADQRQAAGLESPDAAVSATALPPGLAFKSADPSAATPGRYRCGYAPDTSRPATARTAGGCWAIKASGRLKSKSASCMVFQLCSKKALLYAHSFSDGLPAQPTYYYSVHFAATPRKAFRINTL